MTESKLSIRIQVAAARGAVDREFDYIESLNLAVRPPPSAQHVAPITATANINKKIPNGVDESEVLTKT